MKTEGIKVKFQVTQLVDSRATNSSLEVGNTYEGNYIISNNSIQWTDPKNAQEWTFWVGETCALMETAEEIVKNTYAVAREQMKNVSFIATTIENINMKPNLFSKLKARQIIETIEKVNLEVEKLPIEKQRHFCLDCRIQLVGDDKDYGLLEDTGICSSCGKNTDVVNYSIVKLVESLTTNKESLYFYQGEDGKSYGIDRIYRESVKRSVTK